MKRALGIAGSACLVAALALWASGYRPLEAWTGSATDLTPDGRGQSPPDASANGTQ